MAKELCFHDEARHALLEGAGKLARAVKETRETEPVAADLASLARFSPSPSNSSHAMASASCFETPRSRAMAVSRSFTLSSGMLLFEYAAPLVLGADRFTAIRTLAVLLAERAAAEALLQRDGLAAVGARSHVESPGGSAPYGALKEGL